jgi:hypothetical protein
MSKIDEPTRLLWEAGIEDALAALDTDVTVSAAMAWKLRLFRIVHPLGIHYLVPLRQFDRSSRRLVDIGTTCWFC